MEHLDPKRIQEAMRIASSPAGQELIRHLQQSNSDDLNHAFTQINSGDYAKAKQIISQLVNSSDLKKYLKQLGREENG